MKCYEQFSYVVVAPNRPELLYHIQYPALVTPNTNDYVPKYLLTRTQLLGKETRLGLYDDVKEAMLAAQADASNVPLTKRKKPAIPCRIFPNQRWYVEFPNSPDRSDMNYEIRFPFMGEYMLKYCLVRNGPLPGIGSAALGPFDNLFEVIEAIEADIVTIPPPVASAPALSPYLLPPPRPKS